MNQGREQPGMPAALRLPDMAGRLALRQPPGRGHVMYQTWSNLLFLHWEWDPAAIQSTLPEGLHVDTFGGAAWVGIVPFYMRQIRPRFLPAMPWVSNFLELNLRTYVHDESGRPGVWFYSLDCNQPVAVWTARTFFHLPYKHARMQAVLARSGGIQYTCHRSRSPSGTMLSYTLGQSPRFAEPGSLDFFLAERYLLFSATPGGIRRGQVYHTPYPLVEAEVTAWDDLVLRWQGFESPGRPPDHIAGSPGVQVRVFPLEY